MSSSTTYTQCPPPKKHISVREVAYAAAMLDAEGYILGSTPKVRADGYGPYGTTRVSITNTDMRLHDWLIERFGGKITRRRTATSNTLAKKGAVCKDCYDWTPGPGQHLWFLKVVKNFLVLKRQQADCAIALLSLPGHAKEKRLRLAEKIQRLNRGEDKV